MCGEQRRQRYIWDIRLIAALFLDKLFMLIPQGEQLSLYKCGYTFKSTLESRCKHLIYFKNAAHGYSSKGVGENLSPCIAIVDMVGQRDMLG